MSPIEIEDAVSQLAEAPFDADAFPYQFLQAFGAKDAALAKLRAGRDNKSDVPGGVLQRGKNNIHLKTCPPGQVAETLDALRRSPATAKLKAKFILATDGLAVAAERSEDGELLACDFADLPDRFGYFLSLAGISTVKKIDENAFDIRATGRLNKLYVELLKHNPDWDTDARRQDLNHFFARLIFCFFAEDTNIFFGGSLFTDTVSQMSDRSGADVHLVLAELFRAMDVKPADRAKAGVRPYANGFPYVNGNLFTGNADTPRFSQTARIYLLAIGGLDWTKINPDIFGSMIQAVADDEERGALGMHYTSVPNILKVLNPLFLDDLRAKLEEARDSPIKLLNLRKRLARIRVFDPACGSGNFLVIAYKEMRAIEAAINARRGEADRPSDVPPTNFRGIELRHFPAEIARLALIIAKFQCDVLHRGPQLARASFLPLEAANWITCDNALRIDWLSVCPPTGTNVKGKSDDLFETPLDQVEMDFENEGGETYICGNPPYLGSKWQSKEQKTELGNIFNGRVKRWKSLDYISGWLMKAALFGSEVEAASAFVATNSICQGEHVAILWPAVFSLGHKIDFAHTSFKWANLASHNAGVTVIIVGISNRIRNGRQLIATDDDGKAVSRVVGNINAYLISGPSVEVVPRSEPLSERASMQFGNHPYYGSALIFSTDEARRMIANDSRVRPFIRPLYGSKEFISSSPRSCLWITDEKAEEARQITEVRQRLDAVEAGRRDVANDKTAEKLAAKPHRFRDQFVAQRYVMAMPRVSSESRPYLPVGILDARCVLQDASLALYDAPLWNMALIASRLHLVWIATVCGKLKTDYRYSNTLGWNTFPVPPLTAANKADLTRCAEDILLAREAHFPATIAELYDPAAMDAKYPDLRAAHERNDETLEGIYVGRRFRNDTERLETLFKMYTEMTSNPAVKRGKPGRPKRT